MRRPASGWTSVVLVGLMLITVAWSIESAGYAAGLHIIVWVVVGGVAVGALLGSQTWLPATLAHAWSLLLGIVTSAYLGTRILAEYVGEDQVLARSTLDRMGLVRDLYVAWAANAGRGALTRDDPIVPFAFVLTMAVLMWLLSYICTWFVVRYVSWWGAALPSGFALVFNLYQAPEGRLHVLAIFLACALLLAEQTHAAIRIDGWRQSQVGFSPDIALDLLRDGLVVALIVIGLSWMAPTRLSSVTLRDVLQGFAGSSRGMNERIDRLFPNLSYPSRGGGSAFGDTMPLGGSIDLGGQAIFDATVEGNALEPRYFRMAVYDTYTGAGWVRTSGATTEGEVTDLAGDAEQWVPVTQTIRTFLSATRQLYAMPQPAWFSVPVRAELAGDPDRHDVLTVEALEPLALGDTYVSVSRQSVATVGMLRASGTDDPTFVRERYLPLPDSVPVRLHDLAEAISNGATDRYEVAARIEAYLRANYSYSEKIDSPPEGHDRADWFLFEERRGYCDYYSTSFVVLARSVGVPARLAAGYSRGQRIAGKGAFRQHESDAHTWPEVYFPSYGWIEFEPTAGDDPIDREQDTVEDASSDLGTPAAGTADDNPVPTDDAAGSDSQPADLAAGTDAAQSDTIGRWSRMLLAVLGAVALGALLGSAWWQRPFRGLTAAQGAFARLSRTAAWLGFGPAEADTPHEYGSRLGAAIPDGRADIATIVDAYVRERFGRRDSADQAGNLQASWHRLRSVLARAAARFRWRPCRRS